MELNDENSLLKYIQHAFKAYYAYMLDHEADQRLPAEMMHEIIDHYSQTLVEDIQPLLAKREVYIVQTPNKTIQGVYRSYDEAIAAMPAIFINIPGDSLLLSKHEVPTHVMADPEYLDSEELYGHQQWAFDRDQGLLSYDEMRDHPIRLW